MAGDHLDNFTGGGVHLKALALRGFKSFADPVRIELTPGINVVVGPNGSGKSNIVDAISWVLGAQTPKSLRSSKMEDVIFAGSATKGASRAASVELVLDNASSRLGLDLAEVAISRELTRAGDSRYELNGRECRLVDLQELLGDASIGRGQHTIISQGHLDAILDAKPEERRFTIEEAAGIAKFRRRQERTRRRLELVESELARANELIRDLKRRIRPLERQAEAAKRHLDLNDELSQLKSYLLGSQYKAYLEAAATAAAALDAIGTERSSLQSEMEELRLARSKIDPSQIEEDDHFGSEILQRALSLQGRFARIESISTERIGKYETLLQALLDDTALAKVQASLTRLEGERANLEAEVLKIGPALDELEALEQKCEAKEALSSPAKIAELESLEQSVSGAHLELSKLRAGLIQAQEALLVARTREAARLGEYQLRLEAEGSGVAGLTVMIAERSTQCQSDDATLAVLREEVAELRRAEERASEALSVARIELGSASAVHGTLEAGSRSLHAKSHLELARSVGEPHGVLIELLDIEPGFERVMEAALAPWGTAVVQLDRDLALASYRRIKESSDRATVLAPLVRARGDLHAASPQDSRLIAVSQLLRASHPAVEALVDLLLAGCYFFEGTPEEAISGDLVPPGQRIVTRLGDRIENFGFEAFADGEVVTRRALQSAQERLIRAQADLHSAESDYQRVRTARLDLEKRQGSIEASLLQSQRNLADTSSRLERAKATMEHLGAAIGESQAALERIEVEEAAATAELDASRAEFERLDSQLAELRGLLAAARSELASISKERSALKSRRSSIEVGAARLQERLAQCQVQIEALTLDKEREFQRGQANFAKVADVRMRRERYQGFASEARDSLAEIAVLIEVLQKDAARRRDKRSALGAELARLQAEIELRSHRKFLLEESQRTHDTQLRDAKIRAEVTAERIWRELEIAPEVATQIPILPGVDAKDAQGHLLVLTEELAAMGPINHLAALEIASLGEEQRFLGAQIADITASRLELRNVEREINKEMLEVFNSALSDIGGNFSEIFQTLFPGGQARLILTNPEDPLESGVEFELGLPGKNFRRLALLSGGERSLVALGFLFAVFRSRPSPFYVLDEVEAALDDLNLSRLLTFLAEFGSHAQLVIISHQKRTMEIADNLFGVSMTSDGSSKVVSDRLAKRQLRIYAQ